MNVYQSALIPRKRPCPKKFLVMLLGCEFECWQSRWSIHCIWSNNPSRSNKTHYCGRNPLVSQDFKLQFYFISEYFFITAPFRTLTTKNTKLNWDTLILSSLKFWTILSKVPMMAFYDPARQTKVVPVGLSKTESYSILTQLKLKHNQHQVFQQDSHPAPSQKQQLSKI